MTRLPLVVGNWKMELSFKAELELARSLKTYLKTTPGCQVVVCPSFPSLAAVQEIIGTHGAVALGAQHMHWEEKGAWTGAVSVLHINPLVSYVIVGHSEQRQLTQLTEDHVGITAQLALKHRLTPIVCIGETLQEREENHTKQKITYQVETLLSQVPRADFTKLVIAYEPIWAIGTGQTPEPNDVAATMLLIRKLISESLSTDLAEKVRILYGGSVHDTNINTMVNEPGVDGVLVGGASIRPREFLTIIAAVAQKIFMIVKPHAIFAKALTSDFALGAFNTSNLEFTQAILGAADELKSPVIAQTSESAITYAGLDVITNIITTLAEHVSIPVILHLDHGRSVKVAKECIDAGYTSVMIDASHESLEENIKQTKQVVQYAHARGVWVEAELGAILGKEGAQGLGGGKTPETMFTNPQEAVTFVTETNVDALAVSVGTIHGAFSGQEYIRFELLDAIQKALPKTPLVLHGASGIADEHLRQAAAMNVCKVNVDTELRIGFEQAVKAYLAEKHNDVDPRKMLAAGREAVHDVVKKKIEILGSSHKADL